MKKTIVCCAAILMLGSCHTEASKHDETAGERQRVIDSVKSADALNNTIRTESTAPADAPPAVNPHADQRPNPVHHNKHKTDEQTRDAGVTSNTPVAVPQSPKEQPVKTTTTPSSGTVPTSSPVAKTDSVHKKKGLNNSAKGAIIGLGTGAAAGAVIGGKDGRVKGAILGGIIGAGAGAVGGAVIDKHKKKKQAEADSAAKRDTLR